MSDLISMWSNTRMVVLTAMSASLYAAILIPFKVLPIIPGVTEFRPANAIPVVCSFLFGPAAAWGAAIGNLIGDFFGGIGPGGIFGFAANFLYGLIPYKAWDALTDRDPVPASPATWLLLAAVILLASGGCALVVGWGLNLLGFVPFSVLGNLVLVNNFAVAVVLAPFLLAVIHPRVKRARLLYRDLLPVRTRPPRAVRLLGVALLAAAIAAGMVLGNLLSAGTLTLPLAAGSNGGQALAVGLGLLPVLALLAVALLLL